MACLQARGVCVWVHANGIAGAAKRGFQGLDLVPVALRPLNGVSPVAVVPFDLFEPQAHCAALLNWNVLVTLTDKALGGLLEVLCVPIGKARRPRLHRAQRFF